jgi:hypothetical protein
MLEFHCKADSGFRLSTGEPWEGLRVRWRRLGERRWHSFLLDSPGVSLDELERQVPDLIERVASGDVDATNGACS